MSKPPHILLIGDEEENFYQLGLKDKDSHHTVLEHMGLLGGAGQKVIDLLSNGVNKHSVKKIFANYPEYETICKAYSEGLGISHIGLASAYLIPETLSCLHEYLGQAPGDISKTLASSILGCSSFMYLDKENGPNHTRILDFSLFDSYQEHERTISYELNNSQKIFSLGTSGFMFPSLTSVTESGYSFALHQKFTNTHDATGMPIFFLVYKLLQHCKSKEDILAFCKDHKSVTTWGLNFLFDDGDIIELDMAGNDLVFNEYNLHDDNGLYLCNEPLRQQKLSPPYGISEYNKNRRSGSEKILKNLVKDKDNLVPIKALKKITQLPSREKKFSLGPITPSSIQVANFSLKKTEVQYLLGSAPKAFPTSILTYKNIFNQNAKVFNDVKESKHKPSQKWIIYNHLKLAQTNYDQGLISEAYHELQMAILKCDDKFDGLKNLLQFYFEIYQVLFEPDNRSLYHCHQNLLKMRDKLPDYYQNICLLMIFRLEKILFNSSQIKENDFSHTEILSIFKFESDISPLILRSIIKATTHPRVEIFDIYLINLGQYKTSLDTLMTDLKVRLQSSIPKNMPFFHGGK